MDAKKKLRKKTRKKRHKVKERKEKKIVVANTPTTRAVSGCWGSGRMYRRRERSPRRCVEETKSPLSHHQYERGLDIRFSQSGI